MPLHGRVSRSGTMVLFVSATEAARLGERVLGCNALIPLSGTASLTSLTRAREPNPACTIVRIVEPIAKPLNLLNLQPSYFGVTWASNEPHPQLARGRRPTPPLDQRL